jgi:hypothetical protein
VQIFRYLFVCFQTSVYTLGEFHKNRNNSIVFEELSVSIVDLTDYFFSRRNLKSAYISVIYLYVFKLVCTRWENFIRIGITVLYLKSYQCQLWIWRSQISVLLSPVKLHLRPSNPQLTPPTLQIQYCYSLSGHYKPSRCWLIHKIR